MSGDDRTTSVPLLRSRDYFSSSGREDRYGIGPTSGPIDGPIDRNEKISDPTKDIISDLVKTAHEDHVAQCVNGQKIGKNNVSVIRCRSHWERQLRVILLSVSILRKRRKHGRDAGSRKHPGSLYPTYGKSCRHGRDGRSRSTPLGLIFTSGYEKATRRNLCYEKVFRKIGNHSDEIDGNCVFRVGDGNRFALLRLSKT
jgi:hypothetical protein